MQNYQMLDKSGKNKREVKLDEEEGCLALSSEQAEGHLMKLPFDQIGVVRLNPPVPSRYSRGHFLCCIECKKGNRHYLRADLEDEEAVSSYRSLILQLHAILLRQSKQPRFMTGLRSGSGFWVLALFMVASMGTLSVASVFGMMRKQNYLAGVGMNLLMAVLTYFVLRYAAQLLLPKPYDPVNPPAGLIPTR